MHNSDWVISNSPGPLDLVLRCQHDEKTLNEYKEPPKETWIICYNLYKKYGSVNTNPTEYKNRSGLNFVSGYKSDILFIQGLDDPNPFQQTSRPKFVEAVKDGSHEGNYTFLDLDGFGHGAIFDSAEAKAKVVEFLK
jgi:dipeptidyl aminopeptidase/acylaminoacyl peptidase